MLTAPEWWQGHVVRLGAWQEGIGWRILRVDPVTRKVRLQTIPNGTLVSSHVDTLRRLLHSQEIAFE